MIGTSNSLTGALAPFELAINGGMDVAADDINRAGGVDGRKIRIVHVDAKSDLNLSATATLEAIEKGADIVVPICDADLGGPGARAANAKGILAITCAGGPGLGRQTIGPLTFNTYTGSPTESAINAEYAYRVKGWRTAYLLCDRLLEYSKVACDAFRTRWKELGGKIVGDDDFLQSDASIATQITRPTAERSRPRRADARASFPGGSPALKEIRAAYDGPMLLTASFSGTFWLKATPQLSNLWVPAFGSSYGDDPRPAMNAFFKKLTKETGKAAIVDSYPILGYSTVQTIAQGIEKAGTTKGATLGKALDGFTDVELLGVARLAGLPRPGRARDADDRVPQREAALDRQVRRAREGSEVSVLARWRPHDRRRPDWWAVTWAGAARADAREGPRGIAAVRVRLRRAGDRQEQPRRLAAAAGGRGRVSHLQRQRRGIRARAAVRPGGRCASTSTWPRSIRRPSTGWPPTIGGARGVFPALRSLSSGSGPTTAAERFRAHHAVRELIERLAAKRPVALVSTTSNGRTAPRSSWSAHLLRRPPQRRADVVATFRTGRRIRRSS